MDPQSSLSPELREELTAYLDGELEARASQRIEDLLAVDPAVQDEVRRLERAWQALDELPRAEVDAAFTQSTVAMLAVQLEEEIDQRRATLPARRRRQWAIAAAVGLATAVLGFLGFREIVPDPNEALVRDLGILESIDAYSQIGEYEFLRLLADEEVFAQEVSDGQ